MYSNYCRHSLLCKKKTILCVCVRVCVLWIINVNHYGAMLYTQSNKNKKKANRLVTRIHKISPFSPNWSLNLHNLQHLPLTKD